MRNSVFVLVFVLVLALMTGCGSEEPSSQSAEALDVSGNYSGTMTIGKTQIVYDADVDGNSKPYAVEDAGEWEGTSVDAAFKIEQLDDTAIKITAEGGMIYEGDFDPSTNEFIYQFEDEEGSSMENTITFQFEEIDGTITAKGKIVTISDLPELKGLSNEVVIDLVKTE